MVLALEDDGIRRSGIRIPWEDGGAGELFPHIYGAIETALVVAVRPAEFDHEGVLRF